jgi:DHA1 family bicyclomycin/chloramphenicol resistance-like MFS transporter
VAALFVSMLLLALYVGLFEPKLYGVMGLIMLGIGMMGLIYPQGMASYLHYFPKQAGAASALLGILQFALGAASGALANLLHDGTLKPMAFGMAICASISLVGLLSISGIRGSADDAHA